MRGDGSPARVGPIECVLSGGIEGALCPRKPVAKQRDGPGVDGRGGWNQGEPNFAAILECNGAGLPAVRLQEVCGWGCSPGGDQ